MNCEVATFVCNVIQENTYLLSTSDGHAAIIDCGCATTSEQERLAQRIKQWGLSVDLLLFTHLHFDHLWGLSWALQTFPKARAYAHPIELAQAVSPEAQMRAWGFEVPERAFDLSQIRHCRAISRYDWARYLSTISSCQDIQQVMSLTTSRASGSFSQATCSSAAT